MKKLLIIEDDEVVAKIYRNKFLFEGYQVEIAAGGEAGLQLLKSFRPDAILLDLMLPNISGIELMKKIHAEPDFGKVPIIVFSNTYLSTTVREAWKAGATKCLSKATSTPRQVVEAVGDAIRSVGSSSPSTPPEPRNATAPILTPNGARAKQTDAAFQADVRKSFTETLPATLTTIRFSLKATIKAGDEAERLKPFNDLHRQVRNVTGAACITGMSQIAQMSDALEALLQELREKPKKFNASTLRTVASAVDFLAFLFEHVTEPQREGPPAKILVVDDEPISRRAITHAVAKAGLKSVDLEDPQLAFKMLSEQSFDLVFLDVDMPGMNGFELCTKLRALPAHKKTPVVFVTRLKDLGSRASSVMSGGNDFIAKPFLSMELAVKALVCVLRGKLDSATRPLPTVRPPICSSVT